MRIVNPTIINVPKYEPVVSIYIRLFLGNWFEIVLFLEWPIHLINFIISQNKLYFLHKENQRLDTIYTKPKVQILLIFDFK